MQEGKLKSLKDLEIEARIRAEIKQENARVKTKADNQKEKKKILKVGFGKTEVKKKGLK